MEPRQYQNKKDQPCHKRVTSCAQKRKCISIWLLFIAAHSIATLFSILNMSTEFGDFDISKVSAISVAFDDSTIHHNLDSRFISPAKATNKMFYTLQENTDFLSVKNDFIDESSRVLNVSPKSSTPIRQEHQCDTLSPVYFEASDIGEEESYENDGNDWDVEKPEVVTGLPSRHHDDRSANSFADKKHDTVHAKDNTRTVGPTIAELASAQQPQPPPSWSPGKLKDVFNPLMNKDIFERQADEMLKVEAPFQNEDMPSDTYEKQNLPYEIFNLRKSTDHAAVKHLYLSSDNGLSHGEYLTQRINRSISAPPAISSPLAKTPNRVGPATALSKSTAKRNSESNSCGANYMLPPLHNNPRSWQSSVSTADGLSVELDLGSRVSRLEMVFPTRTRSSSASESESCAGDVGYYNAIDISESQLKLFRAEYDTLTNERIYALVADLDCEKSRTAESSRLARSQQHRRAGSSRGGSLRSSVTSSGSAASECGNVDDGKRQHDVSTDQDQADVNAVEEGHKEDLALVRLLKETLVDIDDSAFKYVEVNRSLENCDRVDANECVIATPENLMAFARGTAGKTPTTAIHLGRHGSKMQELVEDDDQMDTSPSARKSHGTHNLPIIDNWGSLRTSSCASHTTADRLLVFPRCDVFRGTNNDRGSMSVSSHGTHVTENEGLEQGAQSIVLNGPRKTQRGKGLGDGGGDADTDPQVKARSDGSTNIVAAAPVHWSDKENGPVLVDNYMWNKAKHRPAPQSRNTMVFRSGQETKANEIDRIQKGNITIFIV